MPAAVEQQGDAGGGGGVMATLRSVANGVLMFLFINQAIKFYNGGFDQPAGTTTVTQPGPDGSPVQIPVGPPGKFDDGHWYQKDLENYLYSPEKLVSIWDRGIGMDMAIYVTESVVLPPFEMIPKESLVFDEKNIIVGDYSESRSASVDIPLSSTVQNNGTLFAHIYVAKHGAVMDPHLPGFDASQCYRILKLLNKYQPKKKVVKTKKLIGATEEDLAKEEELEKLTYQNADGSPIISSYWHANLTLDIVADNGLVQYQSTSPPLRQHIVLEQTGARDKSGRSGWYYPVVFNNEFWQLKSHMTEINSTVSSVPLHINVNPTSWFKFQIYASMDASFKQSAANPNAAFGQSANTGNELEEFKRVLVDTNIYLLGTTFIVSILHTIFEMLAFKNDISHWRNKKDNVGVSMRTILANVFMQTVIFLYLLDNSEGTSWMILMGQGFGIFIEAWKITRTVDVKILPANNIFGYRIAFEDKHKLSELEQETKQYDEEAFKYLYWIAVPLLLAYAVYSVLYDTHKSWYSFIITTLVGSVYAYGFLMMVPSLYINYRLKSVAHMPRKTMIYKLLNTFIDDLFAFTIKMPTLHRLATLRDDVIYFIALYQSWIYRVDHRRVNEFGQGGEDDEKTEGVAGEEKGPTQRKIEVKAEASAIDGSNQAAKKRK